MTELVTVMREDELYRRLAPLHVKDSVVTSAAYKLSGKPANEFSVDIARLTTPEESVGRAPSEYFGLGGLIAEAVMDLGFTVTHAPEGENDAHANVAGESSRQKCKLLAEATRIVVAPTTQA